LKKEYNTHETRRQLAAEYDLFLADDRIVTFLPSILAKAFYKQTSKRPVPVNLAGSKVHEKVAPGKVKPKGREPLVGHPVAVSKELEAALSAALVHLSPSVSTSVKIGYASWKVKDLQENFDAVVKGLVEKNVPRKWANVKGLHVKGPNTMALPVYMAEELWLHNGQVKEEGWKPKLKEKKPKKKRKRELVDEDLGDFEYDELPEADDRRRGKKRKTEGDGEDEDAVDKEIKEGKEKMKVRKKDVMKVGSSGL
jgi:ribosome biogenesis protein UTP30